MVVICVVMVVVPRVAVPSVIIVPRVAVPAPVIAGTSPVPRVIVPGIPVPWVIVDARVVPGVRAPVPRTVVRPGPGVPVEIGPVPAVRIERICRSVGYGHRCKSLFLVEIQRCGHIFRDIEGVGFPGLQEYLRVSGLIGKLAYLGTGSQCCGFGFSHGRPAVESVLVLLVGSILGGCATGCYGKQESQCVQDVSFLHDRSSINIKICIFALRLCNCTDNASFVPA